MSDNVRNEFPALEGKPNVTGNSINFYRNKMGLSAQQLSDNLMIWGLDLHRQTIFDIEYGKRTVTDYELCLIAKVLKVTTDELLKEFSNKIDDENK